MKSFHPQQSGFSLVETLVAITILLVVIVGPMSISSSTARSTSYASEQVIAFFLAQEGAEIAQRARDDLQLRNFLDSADGNYEPNPWDEFTDATAGGTYEDCFSSTGCGLELDTDGTGSLRTPVACSNVVDPCRLSYDDSNGRNKYTYDTTGTSTPFWRVITMEETANREVEVTSRVYWQTGDQRRAQEVVVETYLFNVYGN